MAKLCTAMATGLLLLPAALLVPTAAAYAGTFDIKTPDVTKGETEVSVNSTFFRGYPDNAELLRHSWEIGAGRGLTDWWWAGLKVNLDQPIGEAFRTSTIGTEHILSLRKLKDGVALGWYASVDVAVASDQTNTATFGPILQFGTEKTAVTLNPFLAQTFGRNREEGIALSYGWQAKHELREGFAVGLEGYGVIKNLGHALGPEFQEHRIGPVVYFERPLGAKVVDNSIQPKFNFETGVLFGLTSGTQDVAVKVKGAITF